MEHVTFEERVELVILKKTMPTYVVGIFIALLAIVIVFVFTVVYIT